MTVVQLHRSPVTDMALQALDIAMTETLGRNEQIDRVRVCQENDCATVVSMTGPNMVARAVVPTLGCLNSVSVVIEEIVLQGCRMAPHQWSHHEL